MHTRSLPSRRPGRDDERIGQRSRQLAEPRPEHESPLGVARDQAMYLERDGQPVRGRSGQAGRVHELGEGAW
jgi:hypothetical protein